MKKIKEEKLDRLRERFYHLANLMNLREETVNGVDERSMIWNFINASIHQFLRERDEEWVNHIKNYFKGLIVITDPQTTKEKLITLNK